MRLIAVLAIITVASCFCGCGQKGALVHPDKHPAGAPVAKPATAPASESATATTAP